MIEGPRAPGFVALFVIAASSGCSDATAPLVDATEPTTLTVGGTFSCALRTGGAQLYCWGLNGYGVFAAPPDGATLPVAVPTGLTFESISAGNKHLCGLTASHEVFCWGSNFFGELGDGTLDARAAPVLVPGGHRFTALESGYRHTCALAADSTAWCWGTNTLGQLGVGSTADTALLPAQVSPSLRFAVISSGGNATCGLTADGVAWCWGDAQTGQIGQPGTDVCMFQSCRRTPGLVSGSTRFRTIAVGQTHTCAVAADGRTWCWGANDGGQLGIDSAAATCGIPCSVDPVPINSALRFAHIVAGAGTNCAVAADGSSWCWGANCDHALSCSDGRIGSEGAEPSYRAPRRVATTLRQARVELLWLHGCAETAAGGVYCWGDNTYGQLGEGTRVHRNTPTRVLLPV